MPFVEKDEPCARCVEEHECACQSSRTFSDAQSLLSHLRHSKKHKGQKNYLNNYCFTCDKRFSSKNGFIQHLQYKTIHRHDLHQAACNGRYQVVEQFMRSQYANQTGSSHHIAGSKSSRQIGFTPMHCAAFGGHEMALQIMLNWPDGNPNVKDSEDGRTPVHLAAWKGNANCFRLLLKHGGDYTMKDTNGITAVDLATKACWVVIFQHSLTTELVLARLPSVQEHVPSRFDVLEGFVFPVPQDTPVSPVTDGSGSKSAVNVPWQLPSISFEDLSNLNLGSPKEPSQACMQDSDSLEADDTPVEVRVHQEITGKERELILQNEQQEPVTLPYEVLARGPSSVEAFNNALKHGKARVCYTQLAIIGDVGAGKTSLVRTLSGEEFREEREETHGIITSMVEKTDLDSSWKAVDLNRSHVDEILADRVADDLRGCDKSEEGVTAVSQEDMSRSSTVEEQSSKAEVVSVFACDTLDDLEENVVCKEGKESSVSEESPVREKEEQVSPRLQREMPFDKITQSLCRGSSEDKANYAKISIWDFAGHPLYQTMHHIFLNRRSFYIIVFSLLKFAQDMDATLESVRFWLNSVQVHTPQSTPIFLVGTHCRHPSVSDETIEQANQALNDHFAETFCQQLVSRKKNSYLFPVENSSGSGEEGAKELKTNIEKERSRMAPEELPIRWLHFEEAIFKRRRRCVGDLCCVTRADVRQMVEEEYGDVDEHEFENMLQFYHDSGVIVLPGALVHPSTQHPDLMDRVVLEPQYLVDVMTCVHDINPDMNDDRQFKKHWQALEEKGMADKELLKHAWKDFSDPVDDLLVLLEAVGMLCPLEIKCTDVASSPTSATVTVKSTNEFHVTKYVIPFHLKEKPLHRRWEKSCRKWKGICSKDKVLVFDFQAFLPPALFPYLLVKVISESKRTGGMEPVIARHMGIFSFGDGFYFMLEEFQRFHQVHVFARHQHSKHLSDLYEKLNNIVMDICSKYFRFMKFTAGPPCPNPSCPGATSEGKVLESDSSSATSDEEQDDEEERRKECREPTRKESTAKRQHVVQIDPESPRMPLWCNRTPLQEFEEVREWCQTQQVSKESFQRESEASLKSSVPVDQCCMVFVSERLADKWKKLGRLLRVNDTVIENILAENPNNQEERGYQVLLKWKESSSSEVVNAKTLVDALKELCCHEVVADFADHCRCKHQ